jgi:hypothetical protein
MRERKKDELDLIIAAVAGSKIETEHGPLTVIRERVYSLPYEYHFAFGEEPEVGDNLLVLVSTADGFLDRSQFNIVDDGLRVRCVQIEKIRVPQDIVIVAPLRKSL